jgi:hypothetical protein
MVIALDIFIKSVFLVDLEHQSHQSLQYFTKVLDDLDRNIICDHKDQMPTVVITQ